MYLGEKESLKIFQKKKLKKWFRNKKRNILIERIKIQKLKQDLTKDLKDEDLKELQKIRDKIRDSGKDIRKMGMKVEDIENYLQGYMKEIPESLKKMITDAKELSEKIKEVSMLSYKFPLFHYEMKKQDREISKEVRKSLKEEEKQENLSKAFEEYKIRSELSPIIQVELLKADKDQKELQRQIEKNKRIQEARFISKSEWGTLYMENMKLEERIKEIESKKEIIKGKGKGWHGESERHSRARKHGKADFIIAEIGDINDLRFDSIDLSNFIQTTDDSISDEFTVLHGAITRSGDFPYIKNGKWVTYVKEWDNIKETFSRYSYIPLKASVEKGSHHAKILGYLANWNPHEDTEEMYADFVLFDKIENLTKVLNPKEGYHVSLGYPDVIKNGNRQILLGLDHGALSLGNKDTGRACYGSNSKGASCTKVRIVNHDQQIEEVMA